MTLAGTAPNPLREGSVTLKAADPCTIVVFGATGDLTHRKLLPPCTAWRGSGCSIP